MIKNVGIKGRPMQFNIILLFLSMVLFAGFITLISFGVTWAVGLLLGINISLIEGFLLLLLSKIVFSNTVVRL